ncbi:pirin family protein [Leifsonia shinshuensis]|uniref:Pirin family protein n=1 Tax=Leifsonia shinshuensis TaxID=150026 RepID=A0A7G6YE82_9MICO|nr:pirin family protein [Leifsonia shinshuensis]QNE36797.1 pirin family protein [Leifsonia shinshuensis]
MSNLERDPVEVLAGDDVVVADAGVEILEPREVPLGGPRAMTVRRTLPQRRRSLIGGWCFVDHYGPDDVSLTGGMQVPPHPHTGLQTVSWLFEGEIDHRDSVGSHALVRPGELNLMTAGRGISHSEVSTPGTQRLHGVQLWVALPSASREVDPFFEHHVPAPAPLGDATVRTFVGALAGSGTAATVFSPLVGAELDVPAGTRVTVPLDPAFEHGVLVDAGEVTVAGAAVPVAHLAYLCPGRDAVEVEAGDAGPARLLLLGGEPMGEEIVMWWNFIGRSHEDVVAARAEWQRDVIDGEDPDGRFGTVRGYDGGALPAPALPTVRLKPRG